MTDITVKFDSQLNELVLNGRHGNFEVYNIYNGEQIISRAFPELSSKFVLIDSFNIDGCVFDGGKLVVGDLIENGGEISD